MKPTLWIDKHKKNKDGRCPLYLIVRLPGNTVKLPTGLTILPANFRNVKGDNKVMGDRGEKIKRIASPDKYNTLVEKLENIIEDILIDNPDITPEQLRNEYKTRGKFKDSSKSPVKYLDLFDEIRNKRKGQHKADHLRKFETVKKLLLEFADEKHIKISFGILTEDFYNSFRQWLQSERTTIVDGKEITRKAVADSTAHNHFKILRQVHIEATKKGIQLPFNLLDFKVKYRKSEIIWLTWDEVEKLENVECKTDGQNMALDRFLFRCYTGLRESDLPLIGPGNFITENGQNYLQFHIVKQAKTHRVPLTKKASEILQRNKFKIPKLTQQAENRIIKELCKAADINSPIQRVRRSGENLQVENEPKWYFVSGHTARRSFARRWLEGGGSIYTLSKYLGHSSIDITSRYVGWTSDEIESDLLKAFE